METSNLSAPASAASAQSLMPRLAASPADAAQDIKAELLAFAKATLPDLVNTALANASTPALIPGAELQAFTVDVKPFWQSKTLLSLAASGVAALAGIVGITADPKGAVVIAVATLAVSAVTSLAGAVFHAVSTKKPV